MAAGDINAWRRQNSDPVQLLIIMADGSRIRGNILQPRDKTLREYFNLPEPYIDFDCFENGEVVLAKTSIVSLRRNALPNADQIDKKLRGIEKANPQQILGVGKSATRDEIHKAYLALARLYHPDRFALSNLPPEVAEYLDTMSLRINVAYSELVPPVKATAPAAE
jgi:DnaJ-domain-containing protein 1